MSATESPREIVERDYPEFVRSGGSCVCNICGREYRHHPHDTEWLDWTGTPYLRKLCNGRLVKL